MDEDEDAVLTVEEECEWEELSELALFADTAVVVTELASGSRVNVPDDSASAFVLGGAS